jgi:hypothetical protein
MSNALPEPIDQVRSTLDAILFVASTGRSYVTVGDTQPAMPGPWSPAMQVRGAWIWIHPARMARDMDYLASLPHEDDELS